MKHLLFFAALLAQAQTPAPPSINFGGTEYFRSGPTLVQAASAGKPLPTRPLSATLQNGVWNAKYQWGAITVRYVMNGSQLQIPVTISNTGNVPIDRVWLFAVGLNFPASPKFSAPVQSNAGSPSSILASFYSGAVDLADDDIQRPLGTGFWPLTSPASTAYAVMLFTDPGHSLNPNWSSVNRPIAPGMTDTYTVSLRFGSAGATEQELAGDIFAKFAAQFPMAVPPLAHRPIAALSMSGKHTPSWATNPRGWFNDATVDVTTPAGIAAFQRRLLAYADGSIAEMKRVGAQGGILWDIEGQETDASYIGDPSQAEAMAPELVGVLDQFVAKFRTAGLRIGFTLRPQNFTTATGTAAIVGQTVTSISGAPFLVSWGDQQTGPELLFANGRYRVTAAKPPSTLTVAGSTASLPVIPFRFVSQTNSDFESTLAAKIDYCVKRFGASLFYVDSNLTYDGTIDDAAIYQRLNAKFPGVAIFPEWKNAQHYAYTLPYLDSVQQWAVPPSVAAVYPQAGALIKITDQTVVRHAAELKQAVGSGSILLWDGWYRHSAGDFVQGVYAGGVKR